VPSFEFQISAASSRLPALSPAGRGIPRALPLHSAPDPSLRLKSGFARDDASKEQTAENQTDPLPEATRSFQ